MTEVDYRRNKVKISGERVLVDISFSGQPVGISGQYVNIDPLSLSGLNVVATVNTTVITNISGQPVQVSGQAVKVSGETIKAEISGQTVAISGIIDARVSGQTMVAEISGQTVAVEGAVGVSGEVIAKISGGAVRVLDGAGNLSQSSLLSGDNNSLAVSRGLVTYSLIAGFDEGGSGIRRLRVTASSAGLPSYRLMTTVSGDGVQISGQAVKISGETVKAEVSGQLLAISGVVDARISGQTVIAEISGQTVQIAGGINTSVSGQPIRVSGEAVRISGQTVSVDPISISGLNVVATVTTNISGQAVKISGETISVSGEIKARISGEAVQISGQAVRISGQIVNIDPLSISGLNVVATVVTNISGQTVKAEVSGQRVRISGETVSVDPLSISGLNVVANVTTNISGQTVVSEISGQKVRISGEAVKISGETISVSGEVKAKISGELVAVSGRVLADISGQAVKVSGEAVQVSGQAVKVSGETISVSGIVQPRVPTSILTGNEVVVASVSGGTELGSGVCAFVSVRAHVSASGLYWVGGSVGAFVPNSGKGFQLARGDGKSYQIDNINRVRIYAQVSGDRVSFDATAY